WGRAGRAEQPARRTRHLSLPQRQRHALPDPRNEPAADDRLRHVERMRSNDEPRRDRSLRTGEGRRPGRRAASLILEAATCLYVRRRDSNPVDSRTPSPVTNVAAIVSASTGSLSNTAPPIAAATGVTAV